MHDTTHIPCLEALVRMKADVQHCDSCVLFQVCLGVAVVGACIVVLVVGLFTQRVDANLEGEKGCV